MKNVVLLIAEKSFQPKEYSDTKAELERAGLNVITASSKAGEAEASGGFRVHASVLAENISSVDYEGLFIIGGPGALSYLDNEKVYKILNDFKNSGKPFGAICISPRILAKAGVLKSKNATGWDGDGELSDVFLKHGANYVKEDVVADGNIITANGPMAAKKFGEAIAKLF
jgi:protease I